MLDFFRWSAINFWNNLLSRKAVINSIMWDFSCNVSYTWEWLWQIKGWFHYGVSTKSHLHHWTTWQYTLVIYTETIRHATFRRWVAIVWEILQTPRRQYICELVLLILGIMTNGQPNCLSLITSHCDGSMAGYSLMFYMPCWNIKISRKKICKILSQ